MDTWSTKLNPTSRLMIPDLWGDLPYGGHSLNSKSNVLLGQHLVNICLKISPIFATIHCVYFSHKIKVSN